ncbi:MAG TPA: type I-MYXAN CRISPR-associated protein Cas6/Cmx6 [Gammaproteobacteria bacterium]|nr:type I-MYXAN CRISPR-associated protein Cas6/Cmx6 [Gammaproteobacteria bacterium]
MYWSDKKTSKPYQVPDDIVDLVFRINCKCLPLEHARSLSMAIHRALPWIAEEEMAGIHLLHGAESGNGWQRPEDPRNELLYLSRRTRLTLRLPSERLGEASELKGAVLDIDGHTIEVGISSVKPLSTQSTLFSRYVVSMETETEEEFLGRVYAELHKLDVEPSKLLCGKTHTLQGHHGDIHTRSMMLAELKPEESVKVQQHGLGEGRKLGCGLFIPHKGIAPVMEAEEDY